MNVIVCAPEVSAQKACMVYEVLNVGPVLISVQPDTVALWAEPKDWLAQITAICTEPAVGLIEAVA